MVMSGVAITWRVCSLVKCLWLFCGLRYEVKVVEILPAVRVNLSYMETCLTVVCVGWGQSSVFDQVCFADFC